MKIEDVLLNGLKLLLNVKSLQPINGKYDESICDQQIEGPFRVILTVTGVGREMSIHHEVLTPTNVPEQPQEPASPEPDSDERKPE